MDNTHILDIDIKQNNYIDEPIVRQNDDIVFVVNILDANEPFDLSDIPTVTLVVERQDKIKVISPGNKTDVNQVTFKLPRSSVAIAGQSKAVVQMYDTENRVSTFTFPFKVDKDPSDYTPDDGEKTLIELVLGDGPQILSEAEEAAEYIDSKKPLIDKFTGEQTNLQTQLDAIVSGQTEDEEVKQARVDEKGGSHSTLKNRIDEGFERVNEKLKNGVTLSDVNIEDVNYGVLKLPEDFQHTLPFEIFRTDEDKVKHDFDINSYKKGAGEVYLDYNATSSNDGLTPETPIKHFYRAIEIAESLSEETVIIYLMNKYYPRNYMGTIGQTLNLNKNIVFSPYKLDGSTIGSFEESKQLTWTKEEGIYKTTRTSAHLVLDFRELNEYGDPIEYKRVDSKSSVKSEEGTFYIDGPDLYVRRFGDEAPDSDLAVMITIGNTAFDIKNHRLVFDRVSWFWHHSASSADGLKVIGNEHSELILYKSSFSFAASNGLSTNKVGKVYNVESRAYKNGTDGFNYHGTLIENPYEFVYEYYIEAFDNGGNGLGNNNGSTAHDGLSILRIGSLTYKCEGPVVADVNGCYSILINCISHSSTREVYSRLTSGFFFSNSSAVKNGKVILINCGGGGENTYSLSSDDSIDIYISNKFKGRNIWPETLERLNFI